MRLPLSFSLLLLAFLVLVGCAQDDKFALVTEGAAITVDDGANEKTGGTAHDPNGDVDKDGIPNGEDDDDDNDGIPDDEDLDDDGDGVDDDDKEKGGKKATICHVPNGNPDNAHTLKVGTAAKIAHHFHHDDYDGECDGRDLD